MEPFDLREWQGFVEAGGDTSLPTIIDHISIDSRRIYSKNSLFVPLRGTTTDGHEFVSHAAREGARFALIRKDWNPPSGIETPILLRVEDPLQSFQQIVKTYRRQLPAKVVGIVGSYGKTMVKDFLHAILSRTKNVAASPESFNSQIGVPLSLLEISRNHDIALIEAGFSKPGEMDKLVDLIAPDHCIFTQIGRKHLSTLGSLENTALEILKFLKWVPESGWALLQKHELLLPHISKIKAKTFFWNEAEPHLPHATSLSSEQSDRASYHVTFPDGHSFENTITSGHYYDSSLLNLTIKSAWLLGISSTDICNTLTDYTPEPMRTEIWQSQSGLTLVNDTYCSDPQSVDTSLIHFDRCHPLGRKIFIFGGLRGDKSYIKQDYRRIGEAISKVKPKTLMLVGDHNFSSLLEEVKSHSTKTEILQSTDYKSAIHQIKPMLSSHDTLLIKGNRKLPLNSVTESLHGSIFSNQCFINLSAATTNLTTIKRKLSEGTRIMMMVKASAYGTHDVQMARFFEFQRIDLLGVSYVDEGIALRRAGVKQSIFALNVAIYEASKVVDWEFEVGVSDEKIIRAIAEEAMKQKKTVKVHLHIDTGMSRLGCRPEEALDLASYIQSLSSLKLEGIMTHFACAENPNEDSFTLSQVARFDKVIEALKKQGIEAPWYHASNSSAVMRFDFPQYNMVRIGLAIYGLSSSQAAKEAMELRLAITLTSRIVGINTCKKGETISYGRNYKITKESQRIAVIPIGYFDGLHRNYSGKGWVIIHGRKAPMVGSICMDFMMVDVTDIPNASIGDPVLIFGEDAYGHYLSPEHLAQQGNSIAHELITCLGPRIQRIFIHEENQQSC